MSDVTPVPLFSEFRTVTYVHGCFITVSQEDGVCLRACVCDIYYLANINIKYRWLHEYHN